MLGKHVGYGLISQIWKKLFAKLLDYVQSESAAATPAHLVPLVADG